jgi:hypothetical protein
MDTQVNEALNNIVSWIAPKNKTYSGSAALLTRIPITVAIHSVGFDIFFIGLLERLGISITDGTMYWIQQQAEQREHRKDRGQESKYKKQRKKRLYRKLVVYTQQVKIDSNTGQGYKKGSGLDQDVAEPSHKRPRRSRKKNSDKFCIKCQVSGHCRSSSLLCKFNQKYIDNPELFQQVEEDAREQDELDRLGFTEDDNDLAEELLDIDDALEESELSTII